MSRWFRHYAGMARDDKLVRVALRSKQPVERVLWVWIALLESAAEINSDGRYEIDAEEMAYFLRCDEGEIAAVIEALRNSGRIDGDCVSKWEMRQFKADSSTDRVKRHRERRAEAGLVAQWQPPKAVREAVYGRDGHACVYCRSAEDLTIDHRTPELRGGTHDQENLQTACRQCNARKRDLTHEEFVARGVAGTTVTVSETRQSKETELDTEVTPLAPRKRGKGATVIPKDWVACMLSDLTPKARACAEQWTRASYETVAEGFVLYWRRTGKTTKDWHATWCGWIIREHSKVMRDQKFGNAAPTPIGETAVDPEQVRKNRLALAEIYDKQGRADEAEQMRRLAA